MSDTPTIHQALAAVMVAVGPVAKTDRNEQQRFNFRGIDAVVNAVGPALREHGVVMVPTAGTPKVDSYTTSKGTQMTHVVLPVTFTFYGPAGDSIECRVLGEASDAGDKVMSKAHAVAWRVALLEVFAIPTDDPDPDASSHERQADGPETDWWADNGWTGQAEHDAHRDELRKASAALPADARDEIRAWLADQGWRFPYSRGQMDAWRERVEAETEAAVDAADGAGAGDGPLEEAVDPGPGETEGAES